MPDQTLARSRLRFGPKNYIILGGALVSLAVGYWLLSKGSTTLAPVLLVLGYCVLFPVGLPSCSPALPPIAWANCSSVQQACLTRRMSGVRIPGPPLV